ncbi:MAG: glycosyltransferase family A protein [Gemmatimonas sp.]
MPPFFSVIIPTYNRATLIRRAIDSALSQSFTDFEIVVVDSASTDGTREVVRAYAEAHPNVRLVCEESRRGVCPARNLAIEHSTGEWIAPLDSDDEFPPGTLALFHEKITAKPYIACHRFMCRWDNGTLSPRPPVVNEEWDYEGYLRFADRAARSRSGEMIACIQRSTFNDVRFPEDRAYETEYYLDFALRYRIEAHPEVARLYHTDATDQNSYVPNPAHWLRVAPDCARSLSRVITKHGEAMARVAPSAYNDLLRTAAKFYFLSGDRRAGLRYMRMLWSHERLAPVSVGILGFGLLGPQALAWADAKRAAFRRPV